MRLGVLSDLHCELQPAGSRWINAFASERLDAMMDTALAWFAEAHVDAVVVLGDVVQVADVRDLEHVFARLGAAGVAPVVAVNGNHDLRLGEAFAGCARAHGVALLYESPFELDGAWLCGIELGRGEKLPQYVGRASAPPGGAELIVAVSHFPLLSEASRVAAAGIPYAGDLVNRAELEQLFRAAQAPTVILSGHIHARCTTQAGPLVQFTVGAVIEPPFDATIVELERSPRRVRRTARRLGELAPIDPVFAPEDELWQESDGWRPLPPTGA